MNIFIFHPDPKVCAIQHCDKHVVKMILEYAQLLSTAHRVLDGTLTIQEKVVHGSFPIRYRKKKCYKHPNPIMDSTLYQATHMNHPCAVWVRESRANYVWLYNLFFNLSMEYEYRYGKTHKTYTLLHSFLAQIPENIPNVQMTPFAQAMPDQYKCDKECEAYRNYFIGEKTRMAKWTNRNIPEWYANNKLTELQK